MPVLVGPPEPSLHVLVVNAGSSTLKLSLLGPADVVLARHELPRAGGPEELARRLTEVLAGSPVDAVGHRFVHGGRRLVEPVVVDPVVERQLRELVALAPLHQPAALEGLEAVRQVRPDLPQVACFDTAFHATLPPEAATYAVPAEWRERFGVRRFGFHGLSHAYATRRAAALLGGLPSRLVTCHLGAGASLAAVLDGRSVDTTMGFTPAEGLVMATRSGTIDPGLVTWLQTAAGLSATAVEEGLVHRGGLLALAGSADMRDLLRRRDAGDPVAGLALGIYLHRLLALVAGMVASLGGLDALLFTAGVGERAPGVRRLACAGLGWLGVGVDDSANEAVEGRDAEVTAAGAPVRTLVVHAREDLEIARGVRAVLAR